MLTNKGNDNKGRIKDLIESFTGEEAKIVGVPSELIHFIGDAGKAVLLAQLIYWSDRGKRKDGLVFKTYKEIFQETGIKEKTCNRYYTEFREKGFFDWDVKKANGYPTVHFKLDMDKLTESLQSFWENGNGQFDRNETVKMSESLTENTTQITTDISLSYKYKMESKEENEEEKKSNVKEAISTSYHVYDSYNQNGSGGNPAERISIPFDFEPTWDEKYRAIRKFENKSPAFITQKMIDYYIEKDIKKTFSEWRKEWWNWMNTERPTYGNTELEVEHSEIINRVLEDVYNASCDCGEFVFNVDDICEYLNNSYSGETVLDGLKMLFGEFILARIGSYYFHFREVENLFQWDKGVYEQAIELGIEAETVEIPTGLGIKKFTFSDVMASEMNS